MKEIKTPLNDDVIKELKAGDMVYLTGIIYTARDAAHLKLVELDKAGKPMPFDFNGNAVYYAGPCPAKPGEPIGPVGPTTAGRMDLYAPHLITKGLKVMIGKGLRTPEVVEAMVKHTGIYFAAIGGAAAHIKRCVKSAKLIAFEELGTEAVRELYVEKLPLVVAIDCKGNNVYKTFD
jgi:fumarate hydratase subunit beta